MVELRKSDSECIQRRGELSVLRRGAFYIVQSLDTVTYDGDACDEIANGHAEGENHVHDCCRERRVSSTLREDLGLLRPRLLNRFGEGKGLVIMNRGRHATSSP